MSDKPMWMVRSEGGELYHKCKDRSAVAIGWSAIGSLAKLTKRNDIKSLVARTWPDWKTGTVITSAGQLFRFRNEISIGDSVITYDPKSRTYLVGEIAGDYRFDPSFDEDDPNVRSVKWRGELRRDGLRPSTRNSLGSTLTVFLVPIDAQNDIERFLSAALVEPEKAEQVAGEEAEEVEATEEQLVLANIQSQAAEFIKDRVSKLDWKDAQELVAGLLRAMGYKTQVSAPGADRGKDIVASPDGFGFEAPRIVVEVKHRNHQITAPDIRSFLGGRHPQDRGLYVSTGGFSKDAYYEADRANIPLQLMDLDLLVQTILNYYEKFDLETQRVLPLTRIFWPT